MIELSSLNSGSYVVKDGTYIGQVVGDSVKFFTNGIHMLNVQDLMNIAFILCEGVDDVLDSGNSFGIAPVDSSV